MDTAVVVIGEALVDIVDGPDGRTEHPGGSPMNVAVGLARLDVPTRLVCALGDDEPGAAIRAHVGASGVVVDATTIDRTSTAAATIDERGRATYEFDLDWRLAPVEVPPGTPLVHVGSIGAVLAPGADTVLDAVRRRPAGALFSLDPNVRPSITPSRDDVLATLKPLFEAADVVKLSDEDAAWLWPDRDIDAVLDGLLAAGAGLAAVTLGGEGCAIASRNARRRLRAPTVDVADTIGAGDSFMSGLLTGVLASEDDPGDLDDASLERVTRFALACAAISVSRLGADPPGRSEVGR
ncbi:carbohydrate kinase family protein [Curtobacterium sp. VKM Ac-1376]|uniref:carbohydrate kinase family protein n=1 Tax=Curtobacterium sp. VKM Ac-1376 TaxID=123312 RepID=UPI00188BC7FB|nr:carbohydrate kinase [Curtobacterium sp. VKM Ac-1376]MBF4615932.1 carbohydrate kinase [Curtobacterium sp. VKM Ac-1376]